MDITNTAKLALLAVAALAPAALAGLEWKPFGPTKTAKTRILEDGTLSVDGKLGDASAGFAAGAKLEPSAAYALKFSAMRLLGFKPIMDFLNRCPQYGHIHFLDYNLPSMEFLRS